MRIISGIYKSRKLLSPDSNKVRPTADRAKETLFNILTNRMDFEKKICADLFCGTGSLGLESISRGSQKCYFVDEDIETVTKNVALLNAEDRSDVCRSDVLSFLDKAGDEKIDMIFCDPPFDFKNYDALIAKISRLKTLLALEHPEILKINDNYSEYCYLKKKIGKIHFSFFNFNQSNPH